MSSVMSALLFCNKVVRFVNDGLVHQ